MELTGYVSSILLSCCAIPLAYKVHRQGHARGISDAFLWMWLLGEIFGAFYSVYLDSIPLIFNYSFNMLMIMVIIKYRINPEQKTKLIKYTKRGFK